MARPRVFVSSTFYDLKHVRASLEVFIDSLGFDAVLSEKGDIPYDPCVPLDESCYREAESADIFVLVIGGRYGSAISSGAQPNKAEFFEQYESITKKEYATAAASEIPIYILVDRAVHAEYQTYKRNAKNETISYAHVDSVNIFRFLDHILTQPKNNPVFQFDGHADIVTWLREQWAGLFRDLLAKRSARDQLASLAEQVRDLAVLNSTLRTYLESVIRKVDPDESSKIIGDESRRLDETRREAEIDRNRFLRHIVDLENVPRKIFVKALRNALSIEMLATQLVDLGIPLKSVRSIVDTLQAFPDARTDLQELRSHLGLQPMSFDSTSPKPQESKPSKRTTPRKRPKKKDDAEA